MQAGTSNFSDTFSPSHQVNVPLVEGKLKLPITLDSSSVEIFAAECCAVMTDRFLPDGSGAAASVFSDAGRWHFALTSRKLS